MKQRFLVVYEHGKRNYGGFAPDVLGCVSTGKTLAEMRRMMREALEAHLEMTAEYGDPLPQPVTVSVDFTELDEIDEGEVDHYVMEWLEVKVPEVQPVTA